MGYIKFDKNQLVNLEYSLNKEMIRSNRAGSFTNTTIIGCNTRKYHGLLICPQPTLDGDHHVLLSKVDETVIQRNAEFNIGVNRFPGTYNPKGHKYVSDFNADIIPVLSFSVGGVVLTKETMFITHEERVMIRYTLVQAKSPTKLRVRPFLAFRNIHSLSKQNINIETRHEKVSNGIFMRLYQGYSNLYLQFSKKEVEYVHVPDWYKDFEYLVEKERGYEYHEDLFTPGFFEFEIKTGESVVFSASTHESNPEKFKRYFQGELNKRIPRNTFENCLLNSLQQFINRSHGRAEIIAGYPWYNRLGRYTFITLPGLSHEPQMKDQCKAVIATMVAEMNGPFFPESGFGNKTTYDSADTPLWFFWALQNCVHACGSNEKIWKTYGKTIRTILEAYESGTGNGIEMHPNGLIYISETSPNLTWMNAEVNGRVVTPRTGYVVEINALWYNAIMFAIELAKGQNASFVKHWQPLASKIREEFPGIFWNENHDCLFDYVNAKHANSQIRPSQILAASLPYNPVDENKRRKIIDVVRRELLTPRGLRSLSPKDYNYKGRYGGNEFERNLAFHQGSVWPWLLGHFAEAYLKIYGKQAVEEVLSFYTGFEDIMHEDGIGTINEIYEGDPPHVGRGAISFAASVAEVLRIKFLAERTGLNEG
ncbi:MAG TPA: amylo-alpha-1,6-glucosidase [Bacteroidales bacterium]|nr:amylo-alpha-1,6-glucosidase [Bacteroidales bacterium]